MSQPFIGQIIQVGFNFAPRGWAMCNGQLMSIAQNTALFSLLGTTYGGDGQVTFGLPDFRSRTPLHQGTGPGLSPYEIGQVGGVEEVTLLSTEMPQHTHLLMTNNTPPATAPGPGNNFLGAQARGGANNYAATSDGTSLSPQAVGLAGGSQPHENLQPYLCVTFVIALEGIFPARN